MVSTLIKQLLAVFVATQALVITGMNFGLNSVTLIQVPADADGFLSLEQLSWVISITFMGSAVGGLLATPVAPRLGLRRLLLITCPLNIIGALGTGLGDHFIWILLGRAITFISAGATNATLRGFLAEIAPPSRRAIYSVMANLMNYIGIIMSLFLGSFLNWQYVFLVSGFVPSAVSVLGVLFLPSSPKWLLAQGRPEQEARKALEFYQGVDSDIDGQIRVIQESLRHTSNNDKVLSWRLLIHRETLHPLLLACAQAVIFSWCGGPTLTLTTALVFKTLNLPFSEYHAAMLSPLVSVISSASGSIFLERFGRLPMLRFAGMLCAVGCIVISTFFFLSKDVQIDLGWVVLMGTAFCQLAFAAVIYPLSFNYCNELLPNRTRTLGANIALTVLYVNLSILLRTYPLLQASIGLGGAFLLHAVVSLLQVVFATYCLHETAGLSLEQVQILFQAAEEKAEPPVHVGEASDLPDKRSFLERVDQALETAHL